MLIDLDGLHMQPREVDTHRGQDLGLLKENAMTRVGECMLSHCRLLRLPQMTTAAVFTNTGADAMLCGADVNLTGRTRHGLHGTWCEWIPSCCHWPQELLYLTLLYGTYQQHLSEKPGMSHTVAKFMPHLLIIYRNEHRDHMWKALKECCESDQKLIS